jgi:hypothetical protein
MRWQRWLVAAGREKEVKPIVYVYFIQSFNNE